VGDKSLNGNERNVLLRNRGGALPELVSAGYVAGVDRIEDSRGVGILDIDLDGDLDLVVQGVEKPSVLLVNQGPAGNYLEVRLRGTRSNRDAIGARIEARVGKRVFLREVTTTGGFISGRSLMCHFGLGDANTVDELTVYWPGSGTTRMKNVRANQRLQIVEPGAVDAGVHR
jgi:hypothetical protein